MNKTKQCPICKKDIIGHLDVETMEEENCCLACQQHQEEAQQGIL